MREQPIILVITNSYPNRYKPYAGLYVRRHVLIHRQSGLRVMVLSPLDSRRGVLRSILKYAHLLLKTLKAMFTTDFDLVHAHWILPSGLLGLLLSRLRGKPFVLTSHGALIENFGAQPLLVRRMAWGVRRLVLAVLRGADAVIAVGQQQQLLIKRMTGLSDVYCIDMGIPFVRSPLCREEARRRLGLPLDKRIVVFLGNLLRRKGADVLLRASHILHSKGSTFNVIIGGQGPEERNLLEMIDTLELSHAVSLIGAVSPENVYVWLSAADVCVIPSRTEPFGLVAIESMACGTPVVAADVGGLHENIRHGVNGFLFPVGDYQALADLLGQLLTNDALRESVIEAGYQTAIEHDMRVKAEQVRQIYESLLRK